MTTFDTLSASKRLRDAGVEERAADAIVELVQSAARMPDISDLATKGDLNQLASQMATKTEVQALRLELKSDIAALESRFSEKLRTQGWALMGGMAMLITVYTALIKLLP